MDAPKLDQPPNYDQSKGSNQPQPGIAARLATLLQEMYDAQQTSVLVLADAERETPGTLEKWSLKDTLAHIVAWNDVLNMRLELSARGETPPVFDDVDRINAQIYAARRNLSWSAVLETSRKAYTELVERIGAMDEAELTGPARYDWLEGDPLWMRILRTAYIHPLIHLAYYHNQRGRKALGLQLQEEAASKLLALDPSPEWQSKTIYNLACQYALSGDKTTAIDKLRQALHLNFDLLEWSQQDPDFRSIRDDPEFQAVYTEIENR